MKLTGCGKSRRAESRGALLIAMVALASAVRCSWFDVQLRSHSGLDGGTPDADAGGSDGSDSSFDTADADASLYDIGDGTPVEASDAFSLDAPAGEEDSGPSYPPPTADLRWNPEDRRMAVTNDSTLLNPMRIWLVVRGAAENPHCLVGKERGRDAWLDTGVCGITTHLDAVTFAASEQMQVSRVYFGLDGQLREYVFDGGVPPTSQPPWIDIPSEGGYVVDGGDVAAVTFHDGTSRRIVVMAAAKKGSETGHYCIYENVDLSVSWSVRCSTAPILAAETDVVGAAVDGAVHFYFKDAAGGLRRVIRSDAASPLLEGGFAVEGAVLPIQSSLFAIPSVVAEQFAVGFIDGDQTIWTGHLEASSGASTWAPLPSLPNGLTPQSTQTTLTANTFQLEEPHTALYVLASDRQVYAMIGNPAGAWSGAYVPLSGGLPGRLVARAVGATGTTLTPLPETPESPAREYDIPSVFLSVGGDVSSTLEEAIYGFTGYLLGDHIRPQPESVRVFDSDISESSVAAGPDLGLAAGTVRGDGIPLRVRLAATIDGAGSWHEAGELEPLPWAESTGIRASASHPVVAHSENLLHLVDLEQNLLSDCSTDGRPSRIVYRRGTSAAAIARLAEGSPDLRIVAEGLVSHPSLAVTEDTRGVTVHILYWDQAARQEVYWKLPPVGGTATRLGINTDILPEGRPILWSNGREIYGGTLDAAGVPTICNFASPPTELACLAVGVGGSPPTLVQAATIDIPIASDTTPSACSQPGMKCLRDDEPLSFAATASNRLFVAYAALDGAETSIYVSQNNGAGWLPPVRVNDRPAGDRRYYIDPEVAEIEDGGLVLTFSAIEPSATSTPNRVQTYLARAPYGDGTRWFVTPLADWDPSVLEFDCTTQRWSLGDYRLPSTLGRGRTLHLFRNETDASDGGASPSAGIASRWFNLLPSP